MTPTATKSPKPTSHPSALRHLLVLLVLVAMLGWGPLGAKRREEAVAWPWESSALDDRIERSPALSGRVMDRTGQVVAEPSIEERKGRRIAVVKRPFGQKLAAAGMGDTQVIRFGIQGALTSLRPYPTASGPLRLLVGDPRLAPTNIPDVTLTLDAGLSSEIYDLLAATGRQGSVVVLEIPTGDLWAAVDYPAPDVNGDRQATARTRLNSFVATNLAGSVAKDFSAAYILQFGRGNEHASAFCDGRRCWRAHGRVDGLRSALLQSCNRWFGSQASFFQRREFEQFLLDLNVAPSALGLPSATPGVIFAASERRGVPWTMAVGQETFYSGVGIATAHASLVEGHRITPQIVRAVAGETLTVPERVPVVRRDVAMHMRQLLGDNGRVGTARVVNQVFRRRTAGGKTGTAETDKGRPTDSVFAAVEPWDEPRWVVIVILKGGGRGAAAGRVAGQVLNLLPAK